MKNLLCVALLLGLAGCLGCESAPPADSTAKAVDAPAPPPPAEAADASAGPAPQAAAAPAATAPAPAAAPATTDAAAPADGDTVKKAEVGASAKAKDYGGAGFVTTPIETFFSTRDRIDEIQMRKAMDLYKAGHDNKGPKTHEEYMKVVIQDPGVQLPELPEGSSYWYDVKTEQLMVKSPKPQ